MVFWYSMYRSNNSSPRLPAKRVQISRRGKPMVLMISSSLRDKFICFSAARKLSRINGKEFTRVPSRSNSTALRCNFFHSFGNFPDYCITNCAVKKCEPAGLLVYLANISMTEGSEPVITKAEVKKYLEERDLERLTALAGEDERVVNYIFRCLYSADELLRKRAIEALGLVCNVIADRDPGAVLNILRQLWWSINEESGGIGWSATEAMAEIIKHRPEEFSDYGSITVSFLDEEMLCRGGLWAAGTLAQIRPSFINHALPEIINFLDSSDPTLRGYAARALLAAGAAKDKLELLKEDRAPVQVYENGELYYRTVAELAGHNS